MKEYKNKFADSPLFSKELLKIQSDKRDATIHERYTDEEIKYLKGEKSKQTTIARYGKNAGQISADDRIENPKKYETADAMRGLHIKEFYERMDDESHDQHKIHRINCLNRTNQAKYGVDFAPQYEEHKMKAILTSLDNYGTMYPSQSEVVKDKIRATCYERYGSPSHNSAQSVKDKKRESCLCHFGVDSWAQTDDGRLFHRINSIKRVEDQRLNGEPLMPTVGIKERPFLNELQKHTHYNIIRQESKFRYVIGRIPDGYIEELNMFILFDERHHFIDGNCTQLDEASMRESKNYNSVDDHILFRVSEKEWDDDKYNVIEQFKQQINK
jgi:hypothetical protein